MRILVTGSEGQVARSLAEQPGDHTLIFAARPELDLAVPETIEATVARVHPDLIVSAAAYTAVDKAESETDLAMAINGTGPGILARAGARIGAPIIHLSTDYVFDGSLDRPWREEDPVSPINAYGATKLAGEQAVRESGATYAILRLAWVYSPFGANFVRTMLRLAETRDALNVVDDQHGCPSSALDIATAILKVADAWKDGATSGIYHFAGTGETDWAGFARAIFAESASRGGPSAAVTGIPSSDYPTPARRPANSRLDCARFAETFGYRAPHWQESLAVVVARLLG
jgi:dTDP-4-dehydrorhamnose reductase